MTQTISSPKQSELNKSDQDCPDSNACLKEGCNKQLDGAMCDKGFSLQQSTEQAK